MGRECNGDSEKGIGVNLRLKLDKLTDWLDDADLRTFSRSATYTTHLSVAESDLKQAQRVMLDLGEVKDTAEIKVNGRLAAILVIRPFAADVSKFLRHGDSTIEIVVTNSLINYVSTIQWPKTSGAMQMKHFLSISSGLLGPLWLKYLRAVPR
jgi:hypothetical protein